jgi:hypothetical protein
MLDLVDEYHVSVTDRLIGRLEASD